MHCCDISVVTTLLAGRHVVTHWPTGRPAVSARLLIANQRPIKLCASSLNVIHVEYAIDIIMFKLNARYPGEIL